MRGLIAGTGLTMNLDGVGSTANLNMGMTLQNLPGNSSTVSILSYVNNVPYVSQFFATGTSAITVTPHTSILGDQSFIGQVRIGIDVANLTYIPVLSAPNLAANTLNCTTVTSYNVNATNQLQVNGTNINTLYRPFCAGRVLANGTMIFSNGQVGFTWSKVSAGVYKFTYASNHPSGTSYSIICSTINGYVVGYSGIFASYRTINITNLAENCDRSGHDFYNRFLIYLI